MIAAVVAIFVATTEALAKVVVIVVPVYVITVIAVVGVLIGITVSVVGTPPILAVCLSGPEAFLVTVVNGLAQKICAVLISLVVATATMVTIDRSRVEVRIAIVIGVMVVLEKYFAVDAGALDNLRENGTAPYAFVAAVVLSAFAGHAAAAPDVDGTALDAAAAAQ